MKKIIVTALLIMLFFKVQSQISFKPGVKLGYNSSKITNVNDSNRSGIYVGVFGEFNFPNMLYAFQPEISYSQQGTKNYKQDYFVITLASKIHFSSNEDFYAVIAPSIDFKLNGPKEIINTEAGTKVTLGSDYGLLGGLGYNFPFGLGVEARWKFSLKEDDFDGAGGSFGKNSVVQLGLIYKFNLEKWF